MLPHQTREETNTIYILHKYYFPFKKIKLTEIKKILKKYYFLFLIYFKLIINFLK